MAKTANGYVHWRWLGPAVALFAFSLLAYIGKGVDAKVDAHETRIQETEKTIAVQSEILVRIESKIDSIIKKEE